MHLGLRLWELALRGSTALRLRQAALPHLEQVQARIREHTQLAVLEQDEALFLERLSHPDAGANITRVAGRLPLHASSSGLVLLAHAPSPLRERVLAGPLRALAPETVTDAARLRRLLTDVRRTGVVMAPGSIEAISTGVAVPIRDAGANITRIAGRLPLHASSSGLVLLAHAPSPLRERVLTGPLRALAPETVTDAARLRRLLAEVRRTGVVVAPGSIEAVSTGVAVPIRDAGEVVAALSVVLPRETDPDAAIAALRDAATGIESALRADRR